MSLKTQIEEISAQLSESQAQIVEERCKAEAIAGQLAELEAQHLAAVESHVAAIAALTEERDAHLAHTHEQAERIAAIESELAAANDELVQARQALSNPAYVQASAAGGDPVQDNDGAIASGKSLLEQLEAIEEPRQRRAFYLANRDAIKVEQKHQVKG